MSRVLGILAGLALVCGSVVVATNVNAQIEPGPWKPDNPTFTVQQKGCGQVSDLTFRLTCSDGSGEQRAERRYATLRIRAERALDDRNWPIATDDALTANRHFRGIADMKQFSAPDDL